MSIHDQLSMAYSGTGAAVGPKSQIGEDHSQTILLCQGMEC